MGKYIETVLKHPVKVIITIIILTGCFLLGIPKLRFENSLDVMMPKKDENYQYYEGVKKIYGNLGKFIIMNVTGDNIWEKDFFKAMDDMVVDIEEYEEFNHEKENTRLKRMENISASCGISYRSLIEGFNDDLAFKRELIRLSEKFFDNPSNFNNDDIKVLIKEIRKSYELKKAELVDGIISPITSKDISGENDTITAIEFIKEDDDGKRNLPDSVDDFLEFKKNLQKNPVYERAIYSVDPDTGKITDFGFIIKLKNVKSVDKISSKIWDITTCNKILTVTPQGLPIVHNHLNEYMRRDLRKSLPLSLLVVIMVFFLNFRTIRGVILPTVTLILAEIWVLGFMGHFGFYITAVGISLPPLIMAIGSSYSIHILNQYFIDFDLITARGKHNGLKHSMVHISTTVILAGLTTMFGFFSLLTNQISAIYEWGIFSACGVFFAVLISTAMIPAVFKLLPHNESARAVRKSGDGSRKAWIDSVIKLLWRVSTQYHIQVLCITGILVIILIFGIFKIKVESSLLRHFKEGDYIRTSSSLISKKYGGYLSTCILIDSGSTDGIKEPEFLNKVEGIRKWLEAKKNRDLHIGRIDMFTDVIKSMHMAMNNDDRSFYRIPENRMDVEDYLELYSGEDEDSDGRPDDFERYFDQDYRTLLIFARIREIDNQPVSTYDMARLQERLSRFLDQYLPQKYSYKITGETSIILSLTRYVVRGQLLSVFLCMIAVSIIIVMLFKNWRVGFLSYIPMCIGVIVNFGVMGWFNISLNTITAIIASVVIGIGIDNTIHFLNTYRCYKSKKYSIDDAIKETLSISGKAITYTSLALILGFLVLGTSNFRPVILFGLLMSVTLLATTIGALVILPATIKATSVSLEEMESGSRLWNYFYIGKFFDLQDEE